MLVDEVRYILGGQGVEGFIGDAEFHGEPRKVDESSGAMVPGLGVGGRTLAAEVSLGTPSRTPLQ